tara:strand:+ start:2090 stop:3991 length:1902 start_codon:yes stop_codon:yes gene_type:complete
MKADAVSLLAVFESKVRLEVPLFQRQYVWSLDQQWEPLWEDISRKFEEYIEGRQDAPVHFLGAMVLDQKQTPTGKVPKRQIIDGQQRLTTLQIFLSAFRDFCRANDCEELGKEAETYTLNTGMMDDPAVDKFKVWPTKLDQNQFRDVVESGSLEKLEKKHPLTRRKYARKYDPRPRMIEAYVFFYGELKAFFIGNAQDPPLKAEEPLVARLEECFQALKNALKIVAIDLEKDDDAQVIFETLNARGEPLLPADLLRNYIFLRAARLNENQEELYETYWSSFDEEFWRTEVKQGRLNRPRSDLYMQHFLASRQGVDIPIKHLFVEYKFWIEKKKPFERVRDELMALARQGGHFRRIISPGKDDVVFNLATFLERFDIRTSYPLLLLLLDQGLDEDAWAEISRILESYFLRRAVCGWSTKNYNKIFLSLTRKMKKDGASPQTLRKALSDQVGESGAWPTDEQFETEWKTAHAYQRLNNPKMVYLLRRLSNSYLDTKHEKLSIDQSVTVEHILPKSWIEHWPLQSGAKGLEGAKLWAEDADPVIVAATRKRDSALQTFGNLTILTQALNSSVRNSAWSIKQPEIMKSSLLPINQMLHRYKTWNEDTIDARAKELIQRATNIWPGPDENSLLANLLK